MKKIIDINSWERKEMYAFFKSFIDSTVAVTTEVKCGAAFEGCNSDRTSFSVYCMYAVLRAANEIREMRYRMEAGGEQVTEYDRIDLLTPIKVNEQGKFVEAYIEYRPDFATFYQEARNIISSLNEKSDPYRYVNAHSGNLGVMTVSITPQLYFTSVKHTQRCAYGNDYPLLNIGKAVRREGDWVIPVAVTVNHALVDGHQLALFFSRNRKPVDKISSAYIEEVS